MQTQLKRWGNSQGIIIPKTVLNQAGINIGEDLNICVEDGNIIIKKGFRHKTLEERISEAGGKLELTGEIDWRGEPKGREAGKNPHGDGSE